MTDDRSNVQIVRDRLAVDIVGPVDHILDRDQLAVRVIAALDGAGRLPAPGPTYIARQEGTAGSFYSVYDVSHFTDRRIVCPNKRLFIADIEDITRLIAAWETP